MRTLWALLGIFLISCCQASGQTWKRPDPDAGPWALGFVSPYAMDSWIEDSATIDVERSLYSRVGTNASRGKKNGTQGASGWLASPGGSERNVVGAKLPLRIYVRWQSLVEPQTYQGWVEIPESGRQVLRDSLTKQCQGAPEASFVSKSASVRLGLAPGGVIQVWALDECRRAVKVARAKAEIEPKGPELGLSGGTYLPLQDASKLYVEKYGIPYGSW